MKVNGINSMPLFKGRCGCQPLKPLADSQPRVTVVMIDKPQYDCFEHHEESGMIEPIEKPIGRPKPPRGPIHI